MSQRHDEILKDVFVPENKQANSLEIHPSPSGKYTLEVIDYNSPKGRINCCQGIVKHGDSAITVVNRNYSAFPFAWAEQHANGHDYLICGEHYMGQTIIELDTGERRDYLPEREGFCWASYSVSLNRLFVAVHGCFWACPYQATIFDFSEPLALPHRKVWELDAVAAARDVRKFTWNNDNSLEFLYAVEYNPELNKTTDQMTADERAAHYKGKNGFCWRVRAVWHYPDQEEVLETQDLGARNGEGFDQDFAWDWENWDDTPAKLREVAGE